MIPILSPEEGASLVRNGMTVAFGGFSPAGSPKVTPRAIAARASKLHAATEPFKIAVVTGASTGRSIDGALAEADAISMRTPYQSHPLLREKINQGEVRFFDMHLSMLPQALRYGWLGDIDCVVIEACDVTDDGEIILTSGVGAAPTFCRVAKKIIVELNRTYTNSLRGLHDIYEPRDPPHRREIPIYSVRDRIGSDVVRVDPKKIAGIVYSDEVDECEGFSQPSSVTERIGRNVAQFLVEELRSGRIPDTFLPLQSGVGDVQNGVLVAIAEHPDIPRFEMYTEVLQDSAIDLISRGRITFASTCSLTVSEPVLKKVGTNLNFFRERIVLRPQEITNNPEVVRRLGLISVNTALECDLYGNVNSTHVLGTELMNGIGGSGDFTRNAFLSLFVCPSTARKGRISTIVPRVTHVDHSEHSVQVIATEYGVADLRGKSPQERAEIIIAQCAHPDFRDELYSFFRCMKRAHIPGDLSASFAMHRRYLETGDMRGVDWNVTASHRV